MDQPPVTSLIRRLERLERTHRRLKLSGGIAVAVIAFAVLIGAADRHDASDQDQIRAKEVILTDDTGRVWAKLGMEDGRWPGLHFYDKAGIERARLAMDSGGDPLLTLFGHNGKARTLLGASLVPGLILYDEDQSIRSWLAVWGDGAASLNFFDKHVRTSAAIGVAASGKVSLDLTGAENARTSVFLAPDGRTGLGFLDEENRPKAGLAVGSDGLAALAFMDSNGVARAKLHLTDSGDPRLALSDEFAIDRGLLALDEGEPLMVFADDAGQVIWSAPPESGMAR